MRLAFKPIVLVLAALAAVLALSWLTRPPRERVPWRKDFAAASAEARQAGKPLLVDFTADWCGPCQQMRRTTWSDPDVERAIRNYVPVQVDIDRNQRLASSYGISAIPHLLVLDPDGKLLNETEGAMGPSEFVTWLNSKAANSQTQPAHSNTGP